MIPVSSTMPTKDQRGVIVNTEKKGFSSQAKRFPSQVFLNPGPASYGFLPSADVESPSFSKKGTTGFVESQPPRSYINPRRGLPAPNTYNLQSSLINKNNFGIGVSRVFRLPVAVQLEGPKHKTPAPNQYDVSGDIAKSLSSGNGTSTFLSKTGRDSMYSNKNEPLSCYYEVTGYLIPDGSKAVLSPFKSKTQRILPPLDHRVPGPGAYSPHQTPAPVKRTILPRGFCLTISEAPLIIPKDPLSPGPAHYDIRGCYDLSRHPTAAFASKTDRIPVLPNRRPGPGFYDPHILPKQSFFYNNSRIWLPV